MISDGKLILIYFYSIPERNYKCFEWNELFVEYDSLFIILNFVILFKPFLVARNKYSFTNYDAEIQLKSTKL